MDAVLDKLEVLQKKQIRAELANGSQGAPISSDAAKAEFALFEGAVKDLKLSLEPIAESLGMQLRGKRDESLNRKDDRSMLELALCEEVVKAVLYFFDVIEERMLSLRVKDQVFKSRVDQLRVMLNEIGKRNMDSIGMLLQTETRPPPSRKFLRREEIRARLLKELDASSKSSDVQPKQGASKVKSSLPPIDEGRGGLMAAIKAKKNGDGAGGKGDMLAATKARKGATAGRMPGGLLAAIQQRAAVE